MVKARLEFGTNMKVCYLYHVTLPLKVDEQSRHKTTSDQHLYLSAVLKVLVDGFLRSLL